MALLEYTIGVVGENVVDRALGSLERRFAVHQGRINRSLGSATRSGSVGGTAVAAGKREAAAVDREQQRSMRYWQNAHRKSVDARIADENKRHATAIRNAEKETKLATQSAKVQAAARRRFTEGAFGKIGGSVSGSLRAVGTFGGAALGLAGGYGASGAVQAQMTETRLASVLANKAGDPSLKGQILKDSRSVRGFSGEQVMTGIGGFVDKTGDFGTANQIKGSMGDLSLATGADFGDLMMTAGQAFNVLKDQISDPVERLKQLNGVMAALAEQGAMGAVDIKDLAQDFGKLGAATRGFQGGAPALIRTMGAFAQVAVEKGGATDSAEASTAAARMADDIVKHRSKFEALGVDWKSKVDPTKAADPMTIIADTLVRTGGDISKTSGLFGIESGKIFKGFAATYSEAEKQEKGSGRGKVMEAYNRYAGANMSAAQIAAGANSRLQDPDLILAEASKTFNAAIGQKLVPVLMRLIPEFERMFPLVEQGAKEFGRLAEAFAQDPVSGVVGLVAAKLAFDLAAASAADAGKRLASSLSGAASAVEGVAPGGKGGTGLLAAELGLMVTTMIVTASVVNFEKGEADMTAGGKDLNRVRELADKKAAGVSLTPGEVMEARDLQVKQHKREAATKNPGIGQTITDSIVSSFLPSGATFGVGSVGDQVGVPFSVTSPNKATEIKTQANYSAGIDKLIPILEANTVATQRNTAVAGRGPGAPLNTGNSPSPVKN